MAAGNIHPFPGTTPELTLEEKRRLLKTMRAELPWLLELSRFQAEMAHAKFKILVAQGFTEQQALELLKGTI